MTASGGTYRPFSKVLHWLTVAALGAQFAVGYTMDAGSSGRGRGRGRSGDSGRGRGRGGEYDFDGWLGVHVGLGVAIIVLAVVRLWWRRHTTLPPWAPQLSAWQRRLAHWTERTLYTLLFVIPATGLWLVLVSDDAVAIHVAAHIAFFVTVAAHLTLVLTKRLLPRML